jgi:putative nucleotidyltransferase with HDIG domain
MYSRAFGERGGMATRTHGRLIALQIGLALAAVPVALSAEVVVWHLPLLFMLLALSIVSDLTAVESPAAGMKLSGSFMSLLLAMVFLGGSIAAIIGVVTILVGWFRWREPPSWLLSNVVTYAWFPLLGGIAFHEATGALDLGTSDAGFYALVFVLFAVALVTNFMMLALFTRAITGRPIGEQTRTVFLPGIPSELPIALLAVGVTYLYAHVGVEAIALFGVVLFSFQSLLGKLFLAESRRMELEKRNEQLSGFHVEMLTILLRTLDLRDRMTARHSAAVARYARETAKAAGYSQREQELVHTAALLHDIGKFELSDRVLKGTSGLSEDEWQSIKNHPRCGADLIARVEGYDEVAAIVLAHHERVDGLGYPSGISGDDVPELARIVAIADAYDVMTARDSYRRPMTPADAAAELRREAGAQFDARLVEVFLSVVSAKGVLYRHGEDADFDSEVGRPKRFAPRSRTEDDPQPVG